MSNCVNYSFTFRSIGKKFCQIFKRSDSEDVIQNDIEEPIESPDHNVFIVSSTENLFHDN